MRESEIQQVIALLVGAYPRQKINDETVRAYSLMLADLDFAKVKLAVIAHVADSKYFPSIAEIRERVADAECHAPEFDEAWTEVLREINRVGFNRPPVLCGGRDEVRKRKFSHPAIESVVNAIGWQQLCNTTTPGIERAAFRDMYASARKRMRYHANVDRLLEAHEAPLQLKGCDEDS